MTATLPRPATLRVPRHQAVQTVRLLRSVAGAVENRGWPRDREYRPEAFRTAVSECVAALTPRDTSTATVLLSALAGHLDVTPTWPMVLAWVGKQTSTAVAGACLGAAFTLDSRIQAAAVTR